jgi:hypothetical protein
LFWTKCCKHNRTGHNSLLVSLLALSRLCNGKSISVQRLAPAWQWLALLTSYANTPPGCSTVPMNNWWSQSVNSLTGIEGDLFLQTPLHAHDSLTAATQEVSPGSALVCSSVWTPCWLPLYLSLCALPTGSQCWLPHLASTRRANGRPGITAAQLQY